MKEIPIIGVRRDNPDGGSPDGSCQEIIGLRYDSGAWRPAGGKKIVSAEGELQGATSFFVHAMDSTKTLVYRIGDRILWRNMFEQDTPVAIANPTILEVGASDAFRFNAIGNVLIIFNETKKEMSWAVFGRDDGSPPEAGYRYRYVKRLPELPVFAFYTDEDNPKKNTDEKAYEGPAPSADVERQEFVKLQADGYMAKYRKKILADGYFDGYLFLTYAWELFDGSVVKRSNPICVYGGNLRSLDRELGYHLLEDDDYPGKDTRLCLRVRYTSSMLIECRNAESRRLKALLKESVDPSDYKDIIRSVNVYVTPPVNLSFSANVPANVPANDVGIVDSQVAYYPVYYRPEDMPAATFDKQSGFFLLRRIDVGELDDYLTEKVFNEDLSGIAAKSAAPIDDGGHHDIYGDADATYNGRLFLGDISTRLFDGWSLRYSNNPAANPGVGAKLYTRVFLRTGDGTKTVDGEPFRIGDRLNLPLITSYPDSRAVRMDYLKAGSGAIFDSEDLIVRYGTSSTDPVLSLKLTEHPFLNIAYAVNPIAGKGAFFDPVPENPLSMGRGDYFTNGLRSGGTGGPTERYAENALSDINRVQLSELNNPFLFPAKNSDQVGDTGILGFSANAIPLSQGQFGQHPVFIFTASGMWAMRIGVDPFVQAITPLNGEVVMDKKSVLNIGGGTVFKTAEGLKLIEGSKITNLSDAVKLLDDALADSPDSGIGYVVQSDVIGPVAYAISAVPFLDYLESAVIGYDSVNRELLVANPTYDYAYCLSFKSDRWWKLSLNGALSVRSYPDFYFVSAGGSVYRLNREEAADTLTYIQTRPIDLERRGFKKLKRSILRGILNTRGNAAKEFGFYLFVSVDGKRWRVITGAEVGGTARDIVLNRQLPSAKFIIAVACGVLKPDSFITAISVDDENRMENRLR